MGTAKAEQYNSEVDEKGSYTPKAVDKDISPALEKATAELNNARGSDFHPHPSEDPNDPLNWAQSKKNITLLIISATAFLADYGSATGAVTLIPQAKEWGLSEDTVNHSNVGNLFMIGAGGVFAAAFAAFFGRLPVFFWFTVIAFVTAAWSASALTFHSFMAARILNGFFSTVSQGAGLILIKDMFFFHEHARKINVWTAFIIVSPYMGPLLTAFMLTRLDWQWPFWILTIMTGLCMLGIGLLMDETYYDRRIPMDKQPYRSSHFLRVIGIEQWRSRHLRNSFGDAMARPIHVILKPTVMISCVYFLFTFAWVVGINTTLSIFLVPLYGFGVKQIGYIYFAPVTAAILGQICGHYLHDYVAKQYTRRSKSGFQPEARLLVIYMATPVMLAALVLIGFSLQNGYNYMVTAVAWGLYVFGIMITTVGLTAYNLESYPEASGETAAWIGCSRTAGGFIISYFQVRWAEASGPQKSFGVQAGITAAAFLLVIALSLCGRAIRKWSGDLRFRTD